MTSSYISLAIIALTVFFWIYLVLKITIFRYFKVKRAADSAEKGRPVQATVISSKKTGAGRFKALRVTVEFPNLAHTLIREELRFVDSKPEEGRYEEGRRITILIDDESPGGPVIKLAGGKTVIGKGFLLMSAILLSTTFYGTWYIYKLTMSKIQNDWSRADELFAQNETMPAIGIIFIAILIFQWFLFRFLKNIGSTRKKVSDRDLKYYGEKTTAYIHRYEDTGVSINDNPKVRFFYTFNDKNGTSHSGEDAIVIGKLEIGTLPTLKEREIFYMPQSPENSKFTESLAPQSMAGCFNMVLILQAFIFSCILIGTYLGAL